MKRAQEKSYVVYLLRCEDGSYYTGYTSNLDSRLRSHEAGRGARYTRMRRPRKIVYLERFKTRVAAMRQERQMKRLTHRQKRELAKSAKARTAILAKALLTRRLSE